MGKYITYVSMRQMAYELYRNHQLYGDIGAVDHPAIYVSNFEESAPVDLGSIDIDGDPQSVLSELPRMVTTSENLHSHPAAQVAKRLSDEMNASRINNRKPRTKSAPKSFY